MLAGEPGIGKTRLLEYAAAAADLTVIWLTGVESENLYEVSARCTGCSARSGPCPGLPAPQRDALGRRVRAGRRRPPDRYLVGLATLTVLSGVAVDQPVLCLVDDVHWLDRESIEALEFTGAGRHADSLAFVFAARSEAVRPEAGGHAAFAALSVHRLGGMEPLDARALLALAVEGSLDPAVADRLIAGTGGNPLALIELTVQLSSEQLAGVAPLPARLPVSRMLDAHFRQAISALPTDARTLLLLIAAAPAYDAPLIWQAAGRLWLTARSAAAAAERGILTREPRPAFRHPLIRSVVTATPSVQRRRVDTALAASAPTRSR